MPDERMDPREHRKMLRGAVNRSDATALVRLLTEQPWPDQALQLIGDGLFAALDQHIADATTVTAECIGRLRTRDWEGDAELADQLGARVGSGPTPMLRPLPVRLEELAEMLEGDPVNCGGRIDLSNGDVWSRSSIEDAGSDSDEDEEDPGRWLWVDGLGSRAGYRDMRDFIDTTSDPTEADRLGIAAEGRGAFRRFRGVLDRWPDELTRWSGFSEDRRLGRARAWLADAGYRPSTPRS